MLLIMVREIFLETEKKKGAVLGGVGGASPIRNTKGRATVEIMPRMSIFWTRV